MGQREFRDRNEDRLPEWRDPWNSERETGIYAVEVTYAGVLPNGYAAIARKIADRRMMLAGYRLADQLQQIAK